MVESATLTRKKSVTIPEHLLQEAESRSGPRGLSAYLASALEDKLAMARLDDYLAACEEANGPVTRQQLEQVDADILAADAVRRSIS